jgi:hypothetical protein
MATDPAPEPTIADVYHLVGLVHAEVKLARQETASLQRQFDSEMRTIHNELMMINRRFDAVERDLSTLFRQQLEGGEER